MTQELNKDGLEAAALAIANRTRFHHYTDIDELGVQGENCLQDAEAAIRAYRSYPKETGFERRIATWRKFPLEGADEEVKLVYAVASRMIEDMQAALAGGGHAAAIAKGERE